MTDMVSPRFRLPYLAAGQAQKEITHNEALILLDAALHPVVEWFIAAPPVGLSETDAGRCWLVGGPAENVWQGHEGEIACWTGGSWRFLKMPDGGRIYHAGVGQQIVKIGGNWQFSPIIPDVSDGNIVDSELRSAFNMLLSHLRMTGQLAA